MKNVTELLLKNVGTKIQIILEIKNGREDNSEIYDIWEICFFKSNTSFEKKSNSKTEKLKR